MSFQVKPLTPAIGAVVEGVDLAQPMSDDLLGAIRQALLDHKVIFFEHQHVTPVQHRDFAARFGDLHTHPLYPGVPEAPELFILDNHAGNPTDNDSWHTDVTFIETPPMASILYARSLPALGGDTIVSGSEISFSIQNLFDRDPPFVNNPTGFAYDPTNASPLGRVVSLEIRRRW